MLTKTVLLNLFDGARKTINGITYNPITELEECGWSNADGYLTVNKEYTVYAKYYSWFSGIDAYLVCDDERPRI